MAKEIERFGIPVAVMTAIPMIPLSVGASRVVRGVRVEHVCGDPRLSRDLDREVTRNIVAAALRAVQTDVSGPTLFEPSNSSAGVESAHAS